MKYLASLIVAFLLVQGVMATESHADHPESDQVVERMLDLVRGDERKQTMALVWIRDRWEDSFIPMILEAIHLSTDRGLNSELIELLGRQTGKTFGYDTNRWYRWVWNRPEKRHPEYAEFKSRLYRLIDPVFGEYFSKSDTTRIRLDEIRWGGVKQDGIPPLRNPEMIAAEDADYLDDDNVVFALQVNGDARAYPKRILAWHEMFVDEVGGVKTAGVYCTLCGSMILYETVVDGIEHHIGTSGFLYRSNKLMYDKATQSLWNTLWGEPVVGALADSDIVLPRRDVVTTTWGEWRRRHPETTVLSPNTGHQRDYSEGAAYANYFGTDELMFTVPRFDTRLKNKDEVLALILPEAPDQPLAISAPFLMKNPVHHDALGTVGLVILTDASGANRVYESGNVVFESWDQDRTVTDTEGRTWTLTERSLESEDGTILNRLPAHRAFWFGWFAQYPATRLVN